MSPERKSKYGPRPVAPEIEVFPSEIVEKIKSKGEQLVSPFWIFSRFGLRYIPKARDLIIAMLSQTSHGHEINFIETGEGLRICANNIGPLLNAMDEIYLSTIDYLPKSTKRDIDKHFAPQKADRDWKK